MRWHGESQAKTTQGLLASSPGPWARSGEWCKKALQELGYGMAVRRVNGQPWRVSLTVIRMAQRSLARLPDRTRLWRWRHGWRIKAIVSRASLSKDPPYETLMFKNREAGGVVAAICTFTRPHSTAPLHRRNHPLLATIIPTVSASISVRVRLGLSDSDGSPHDYRLFPSPAPASNRAAAANLRICRTSYPTPSTKE